MATIIRRQNKDSVSFRIQVRVRNKGTGKSETKVLTWRKPDDMSEREAGREAQRISFEFEEKVRIESENITNIKSSIKLKDYCNVWLEQHIKPNCSPSYYSSTKYISARISEVIGNYELNGITPMIAQKYIDSMIKHKITTKIATAKPNLAMAIKEKKMTYNKMVAIANVCPATIRTVLDGNKIQLEKAVEIAKALGVTTSSVFDIKIETRFPTMSTVAKHFRTLRAILAVAKKQQIIKENYAKSEFITPVKEKKKLVVCLDDNDSRTLAQGLWNEPDIRKKTSLLILLQTGVRRGELCGLEWNDIDLEKGEMKIIRSSTSVAGMGVITKEPKTETSTREITLPTSLIKLLLEYKEWWKNYTFSLGDRYGGSNRLFLQSDGKPMYPSTLRYWLKLTTQKLGLPNVNVHSLRHTNITMQLIAGVPIKTVSARAGHSSTKVTADVYSHFIKSSDKDAADKIDKMFGKI